MLSCKSCQTPMATKSYTDQDDPLYTDPTFYQRTIGALQYLIITHPDIAYDVNVVCQRMHEPLQSNFQVVKRILRFLHGTVNYVLQYTPRSLLLNAYAKAN